MSAQEKVSTAIQLLNQAGHDAVHDSRGQIENIIREGKSYYQDYKDVATETMYKTKDDFVKMVKKDPARAVLSAGAVGLVLGLLISGRRKH